MDTYPDSYEDEPQIIFHPLSAADYALYYELEMGNFSEDLPFYLTVTERAKNIVELGCGSGRLTGKLAMAGKTVTGIDISMEMLRLAKAKTQNKDCFFAAMDIRQLALEGLFEAILIPYNMLNLLETESEISEVLTQCHRLLAPNGNLALQLYIPSENDPLNSNENRKNFQFQILEMEQGGRLIKEILRCSQPDLERIEIEERYRVRPLKTCGKSGAGGTPEPLLKNQDLSNRYSVFAWSRRRWLTLFEQAGYRTELSYRDYELTTPGDSPSPSSSLLLISLKKK